jgi:UDP-N-acetylglucosamine 2-epimerase (non-hydrolysing)
VRLTPPTTTTIAALGALMKILHVVGARPNFMKIAPLIKALERHEDVEQVLIHTGQHYDEQMSASFFEQLDIPEPTQNLDVRSGSHAAQTADIMTSFEPVLLEHRPDVVVVVGDVNSTVACALVAAKLGVPVAHVEAGLRSRDRRMPEEINRLVTDQLSDLLFTPSRDADANLLREGIAQGKIHFVGNIMIDTLHTQLGRARALGAPQHFGVEPGHYHLVTLHRPSNVDDAAQLEQIFLALADLARTETVLFPMHPRTRANAQEFDLLRTLGTVRLLEPLGYLEMLGLMAEAGMVLTDSGGIQEETTALGVPCLTLRDSTERPITIEQGTNTLVPDRSCACILGAARAGRGKRGRVPAKWDGHTAERIATILVNQLSAAPLFDVEEELLQTSDAT